MKTAVLGSSGTLGKLVCEALTAVGHEVVPVSRAHGVDVTSYSDLTAALAGVDAVVDCLNTQSISRKKALEFFVTAAQNVTRAAVEVGVKQLVCVSIYGVQNPKVAGGFGYYEAKAEQENIYLASGLPLTLIRSTQWFEFIEQLLYTVKIGPLALVPKMLVAPVSAAQIAELVAQQVQTVAPAAQRTIVVRGPERMQLLDAAKQLLAAHVSGAKSPGQTPPKFVVALPFAGTAVQHGALIPEAGTVTDLTLAEYIKALKP